MARSSDTSSLSTLDLDRCLHHKGEERMDNLRCCQDGGLAWVVIDRCNLNHVCADYTQSSQAIEDG